MSGTLFIVGTPIGNLGDMSPRAVDTLRTVDFIAAEDTRVSLKLLNRFEIDTPMVSYHEHNRAVSGPRIVERLAAGESCALITDAGMPAISDPGEDLVRLCHESGIAVATVPGPSALITALALSGMDSRRFCFEGFLSANKSQRRAALDGLKNEGRTMIFYEAPHKLAQTLRDMTAAFGDLRQIALVKELTKLHEQVLRCTLAEAAERFAAEQPRGEYVLVVAGASEQAQQSLTLEQAAELARTYIADGMTASKAAARAAADSGLPRGEIYRLLVNK